MFVQDHHSLDELQQRAKTLTQKRLWLRYQAVVLAKQGRSAPEIAQHLGCSRRAVQTWVAKYNQGGLPALQERPHTGRPASRAGPEVNRFHERLEAGPKPEDGACTLQCRDLRRILEEEFGVTLRRQARDDLRSRDPRREGNDRGVPLAPGPPPDSHREGRGLLACPFSCRK